MSDTIAAVATGAGVSAIGIVRVSGPLSVSLMDALFRPADGKAMSQHRDRQLVYGKLLDMGATMIQTDRPELLISYLRSQGRHD